MSVAYYQEIACQQVLVEDSSVFSIQWCVLPAQIATLLTAQHLLERYLGHIRRSTLSAIRPHVSATGIELRLLGSRLSLISFLPPQDDDDAEEASATLRICGGLLVEPSRSERGKLCFEVAETSRGTRVSLRLSEFRPLILGSSPPSLIRLWIYRLTQAFAHRLVTVRFLARLHRELTGSKSPVRVLEVKVREGTPV